MSLTKNEDPPQKPPEKPRPADPKNPYPKGRPCRACHDVVFCTSAGFYWWMSV